MKLRETRSQTGRSIYVVLPKDIVESQNLKKGDTVIVSANEETKEIIIKKVIKEK